MNLNQQLTEEVKSISDKIIQDKCNAAEPQHELLIVNEMAYIVDEFRTHIDKNYIIAQIEKMGFVICKRSEWTHRAVIAKVGSGNYGKHIHYLKVK